MSSNEKILLEWEDPKLSFYKIVDMMHPDIDPNLLLERIIDLNLLFDIIFVDYSHVIIESIVETDVDYDEMLLLDFSAFLPKGTNIPKGNKRSGIITCERRCYVRTIDDLETEDEQRTEDFSTVVAPYFEASTTYFKAVASLLVPA